MLMGKPQSAITKPKILWPPDMPTSSRKNYSIQAFQNMKKKTYKNKLQTLFSFIKTAEGLGIHRDDLGHMLHHFVKICMPSQRSIISRDPAALDANIDCLLTHITLDSEKKVFVSHLKDHKRTPGQDLAEIGYDLTIIYNN